MMLRDFKFLRRNSSKRNEEIENVNVNIRDATVSHTNTAIPGLPRPPLSTIHDPIRTQGHRGDGEAVARSKVERTPTRPKRKIGDSTPPVSTPDKHKLLFSTKTRFGWAQKNDCNSISNPWVEEGKLDSNDQVTQNRGVFQTTTPKSTRTAASTNSSYSEADSTHSTPAKSVSKPLDFGVKIKGDGNNGAGRHSNFSSLYRGVPVFGASNSAPAHAVEVPHFDLRGDPSFWMDHNIQVVLRVRPLNSMERNMHGYNRCLKQESAKNITWIGQPETRFAFDHVACETIDQETLFTMAGVPMVENCLTGYNSCVFAYGQTGSGKTYTMLGNIGDLESKPSPHRGMTPRIFEFLFSRIHAEEEARKEERLKYNCKCSFLEIYNEQITDLLDPSSVNVLLREDAKKNVYVENLSEFEVRTVSDILNLLGKGSLNRKVSATNMNRESSRSHSVFTCIIESRWENDSTTNLRFARLNLVDLAGSERQKSSGAEGERLKEAANINKSLSTLGHVIMILVDVANGKPKHVPYRDSRLTFLLQDSLGGNSKTMIIANVSSSICCAAETLNTLKFAQRAKLIKNNAVVNEDSTADVSALQHQILLLKDELSALKRQNTARCLSFGSTANDEAKQGGDDLPEFESKGFVRISTKQLKSLETTLAGALRREQMAETSLKKLEAEIENLNRLVRQREEDSRSTKMMLKFREDKIKKMESLIHGYLPPDSYLLEETTALKEEICLLRAKLDKNPEVTRFALENIRLLDEQRRFQEFYGEGERDVLLGEVSSLREQLLYLLDRKPTEHKNSLVSGPPHQLKRNNSGNPLLEEKQKFHREKHDLHLMPTNIRAAAHEKVESQCKNTMEFDMNNKVGELDLQLERDILKMMIQEEERTSHGELQQKACSLNRDLGMAEEKIVLLSKQWEDKTQELKEAASVMEALESQHVLSVDEVGDLKKSNSHYVKRMGEMELEIMKLKGRASREDARSHPSISTSQAKFRKMYESLDKAKRLNMWYQNDRACQASNEEEMEEVRRQAEAETAEVIVCLQDELSVLQQEVQSYHLKEMGDRNEVLRLEKEMEEMQEKLYVLTEENTTLHVSLMEKESKIRNLSEEWELLACEMEGVLENGEEELTDALDQSGLISGLFPQRRVQITEQFCRLIRTISEKDLLIKEIGMCLEDAKKRRSDMEHMLASLRDATIVINNAHRQECNKNELQILHLQSELSTKASAIAELEDQMKKETVHAAAAAASAIEEAEEEVLSLKMELKMMKKLCVDLEMKFSCVEEENNNMKMSLIKKGMKTQIAAFQADVANFERHILLEMESIDHKVWEFEQIVRQAGTHLRQTKEFLEMEVGDGVEKAAEAFYIFAKFGEAQEAMKEADIMINELVIANETIKLQVEQLKNSEISLTSEKNMLIREAHTLRSIIIHKDQLLEDQMKQSGSHMKDLEHAIAQTEATFEGSLVPMMHDFCLIKDLILNSRTMVRSWLEDIWSEIIGKDCAVSVLYACHMGMLLEIAMGLGAEKSLLQHGLSASNSIISDQRERDSKSGRELKMCQTLEAKLLGDIKNNFVQIVKKEGETAEISTELNNFKKKIRDLQLQEEVMLHRGNSMATQLAVLMKEMDLSIAGVFSSFLNAERLGKEREEALNSEAEVFMVEICSNEFELAVLTWKVEELAENNSCIENLKEELFFYHVDGEMKEQMKEAEVALLQEEARERERKLSESTSKVMEMNKRCCVREEEIQHQNNVSKCKLDEILESRAILLSKIEELEVGREKLMDQLTTQEKTLESSSKCMSIVDQQNQTMQKLQSELHMQGAELSRMNCLEEENHLLKNEICKLKAEHSLVLRELEGELEAKSDKLKQVVARSQLLEAQLKEKSDGIRTLELDLKKEEEARDAHSFESVELRARLEKVLLEKSVLEMDYSEQTKVVERLKMELSQQSNAVGQTNTTAEALTSKLKEQEDLELCSMKENLEKTQVLAESRKIYSEEKEAEIKLLERSVEELECTVNVLEEKVEILKEETERQRLQREELEYQLDAVTQKMQNISDSGNAMKRVTRKDSKRSDMGGAWESVKNLKRDVAEKDAEIAQFKAHVAELTLHAEAQAKEYKKKFKALEAMAQEDARPESNTHHGHAAATNPASKSDKNGSRPKGSGSPFKCIGLGLTQQMRSEKDEELASAIFQIEELESLASRRKKEIFELNARLAAAESMTHDVIRDLLGVKLDMTNYASMLDNQKVQEPAGKVQATKRMEEQEILTLKHQLGEFIEERKRWLEEIDEKQAEIVAMQVAMEKLQDEVQLFETENEVLKMENKGHKKKEIELQGEVKNLYCQQNLLHRIHHHAKIKEENNLLKYENQDLHGKLARAETILSRVREELAHHRISVGKNPYINFDEEQRLMNKLKESEDDRVQLAHMLFNLCSNILTVAGIANHISNVTPDVAEDALVHLKNRLSLLERELEEVTHKYRMTREKIHLAKLMPQPSLVR